MTEYENWINTLLTLVQTSSEKDYSKQIRKGLEKIEVNITDNLVIKKKLYQELKKYSKIDFLI